MLCTQLHKTNKYKYSILSINKKIENTTQQIITKRIAQDFDIGVNRNKIEPFI